MYVCNFSHTKWCQKSLVWPTRRTWCVFTVKNVPLHTFRIRKTCICVTYLVVSACKFSHERMCLYTACHIISYVWAWPTCFHAVVHYKTCSCACSRTTRRVSAHFLTYEDMSMRNFKHITPCLSHNFPQVQSKQSTSQLSNLRTLFTMQLLTYKDVSVCKLSHTRTCLCVTWHLISHVVSQPPCVRTKVPPTRRAHTHFWFMKTRLCVTCNTLHHIFHLTFHRCPRNDIAPHDFNLGTLLSMQLLTYETMSENIDMTDATYCKTCSLRIDVLSYKDVSV